MNNPTEDEILAMAHEADDTIRSKPFTAEMLSFLERFYTLCRAPLVAENAAMKQAHEINADTLNAMQVEIDDWKARALKAEQAGEPVAYIAWKNDKPCYEGDDAICEDAVWPVDPDDDRISMPVFTAPQPAAQEPTSAVPVVEPVAWSHGCNALCANIDLWISSCPHCGKPRPAAPVPQEQTSAVPVVEQLVEALKDAQRAFSPAIHVGVSSAIAAGQ